VFIEVRFTSKDYVCVVIIKIVGLIADPLLLDYVYYSFLGLIANSGTSTHRQEKHSASEESLFCFGFCTYDLAIICN